MEEGAALVMVTDGVVEGPGLTLDAGLERAGTLAGRALHDRLDVEAMADLILDAVVAVDHLSTMWPYWSSGALRECSARKGRRRYGVRALPARRRAPALRERCYSRRTMAGVQRHGCRRRRPLRGAGSCPALAEP